MQAIEDYLLRLQKSICEALSVFESKNQFQIDQWARPTLGGGKTCVLQGGDVIEKAGIGFSHVYGHKMPASGAVARRPELADAQFEAIGLSLIIHPRNPYVPTTHANLRFFLATRENAEPIWWFGGGFDLTPYYGFEEDCIHWHKIARQACQPLGKDAYGHYKKWCDTYFYLPHRQEQRGIGGLFFDDLNTGDFETCFDFFRHVGDHFLQAYLPILEKRYGIPFGEQERAFQSYRRGRYAEFNLIYDRGTLFGLQSGGRTESILMSLPPQVSWLYDWHPVPESPEAKLTDYFLQPRDWLGQENL